MRTVKWLALLSPPLPHWKVPPGLKFIFSMYSQYSVKGFYMYLSCLLVLRTLASTSTLRSWFIGRVNLQADLEKEFLNLYLHSKSWCWCLASQPCMCCQTSSLFQLQWLNIIKISFCPYTKSAVLPYTPYFPCFSRQGELTLLWILMFCLRLDFFFEALNSKMMM